jgi:hypothetical protein
MPPKSIAVPANPSARRGRRLPASPVETHDEPAEHKAPLRQPRAISVRPVHRYGIGERLLMGGGGNIVARAASFCKVVALLPDEGRGASLLYRVRSDSEQFERIVAEADLSRA